MDTKKASKLIIVLLICINVFMAIFIYQISRRTQNFNAQSENVIEILEYRGIRLNTTIPYTQERVGTISSSKVIFNEENVQYISDKIDGEAYTDEKGKLIISSLVDINRKLDRFESEVIFKSFMKELGLSTENFILDYVGMEGPETFVLMYIYKYNNQYLYDSNIAVKINDRGSIYIELIQYYFDENTSEKKHGIIPVTNVLLSSITRIDDRRMNIINIDMGYITDNKGKIYHSWRIKFDDGVTRYFSTETGKEIVY